MNKNELENKLKENNVISQSYSLTGGLPNEAYCLQEINKIWNVYYSETGLKSGLRKFNNEEDACNYFFTWIMADTCNKQ
jgi:hypothetical protein